MAGLSVYVIYQNPTDYPGRVVLRRQVVTRDKIVADAEPIAVVNTVERARKHVPTGLVRLDRDPNDEPQIVEMWL